MNYAVLFIINNLMSTVHADCLRLQFTNSVTLKCKNEKKNT